MALPNPFLFNPVLSATPSPDRSTFAKGNQSCEVIQGYAQEIYGLMSSKLQGQTHLSLPKTASPIPPPPSTVLPKSPNFPVNHPLNDPKYLTMASRIAAYYQQRSQAVANYQHQKCKEWANVQQQKTREMTQVTMLVVAWYVRDRISRRRKRQKKLFNQGLSKRVAISKVNKGESVRRWAMSIPGEIESPHSPVSETFADAAEADFDVDMEVPPDKDTELFKVADHLIRSQLAKVDVPLFGTLAFDESEEEEEEEQEEYVEYDDEEEDDLEDEFDDDDEFSTDEIGETDGGGGEGQKSIKEEAHSDEVQVGSGKASRKYRGSSA